MFIVGHLGGERTREVFPIERENGQVINVIGTLDIKGQENIKRVYDAWGLSPRLTTMQGGNRQPKIVQPVSAPDRINKNQNGRRFKGDGEPMFTLTEMDRHGVLVDNGTIKESANANCIDANYFKGLDNHQQRTGIKEGPRIRKLTPRECWRLQGFPDQAFDKAMEVNSDSQLYKQAGNSVTVNVVYEIAKRLQVIP